jgi:hypothetical protein
MKSLWPEIDMTLYGNEPIIILKQHKEDFVEEIKKIFNCKEIVELLNKLTSWSMALMD